MEKTAKQVRRYIRRQTWFQSFRRHVLHNSQRNMVAKIKTLAGLDYEFSLDTFCWIMSVEGFSYWYHAKKQFLKWYYYGTK